MKKQSVFKINPAFKKAAIGWITKQTAEYAKQWAPKKENKKESKKKEKIEILPEKNRKILELLRIGHGANDNLVKIISLLDDFDYALHISRELRKEPEEAPGITYIAGCAFVVLDHDNGNNYNAEMDEEGVEYGANLIGMNICTRPGDGHRSIRPDGSLGNSPPVVAGALYEVRPATKKEISKITDAQLIEIFRYYVKLPWVAKKKAKVRVGKFEPILPVQLKERDE